VFLAISQIRPADTLSRKTDRAIDRPFDHCVS
jgi:hypothetical protein